VYSLANQAARFTPKRRGPSSFIGKKAGHQGSACEVGCAYGMDNV
jgi:hypothetical protein